MICVKFLFFDKPGFIKIFPVLLNLIKLSFYFIQHLMWMLAYKLIMVKNGSTFKSSLSSQL